MRGLAGTTSNSKAVAVSAVPARAVPPSRRDKGTAAAPGPAQPGLQRAGTGQPPQQGAHLSLGLSLTDICTGNDFSCTGSVSGESAPCRSSSRAAFPHKGSVTLPEPRCLQERQRLHHAQFQAVRGGCLGFLPSGNCQTHNKDLTASGLRRQTLQYTSTVKKGNELLNTFKQHRLKANNTFNTGLSNSKGTKTTLR